MKKLLTLSLLISSGSLFAQRSDTVFQQLFSNSITSPADSALIQNIGQSQHILYVTETDRITPGACGTNFGTFYLEGSYDNVTFFPLSPGVDLANAVSLVSTIYVYGMAPFLKVHVSFNSTNCVLNLYYAGSLYPILGDPLSQVNTFDTPGLNYFSTHITTATSTTVLTPDALKYIAIYGMVCSNVTTQDVTFDSGGSAPIVWHAGDKDKYILPIGKTPYLNILKNHSFVISTTGATVLDCMVQFRYER